MQACVLEARRAYFTGVFDPLENPPAGAGLGFSALGLRTSLLLFF